jgi:ceramide glucosyltransferase
MAVLSIVLFLIALAGLAYTGVAAAVLWQFARMPAPAPLHTEPNVTILKPLHGDEESLFENLRSFCDQEYDGDVQVLFGVRDAEDAASAVAARVAASFPGRDLAVVVDGRVRAANLKVANLLNMMDRARHDVIVLADSDTRVTRTYLRSLVAALQQAGTGAVTCLYRGGAGPGFIPTLGCLFISNHFAPAVLVARALSPMDFCLGATIALTRQTLERIGGFSAVGSYLADDQMIGKLVRAAGFDVKLSGYVVEHTVAERDFGSLWSHELRWARTMLAARPLGYVFSFIMYAIPLALIFWAVSGNLIAGAAVTAAAVAGRLCVHFVARKALRSDRKTSAWLVVPRDMLSFGLWLVSFFGRGVRWRDEQMRIRADGKIEPQV